MRGENTNKTVQSMDTYRAYYIKNMFEHAPNAEDSTRFHSINMTLINTNKSSFECAIFVFLFTCL